MILLARTALLVAVACLAGCSGGGGSKAKPTALVKGKVNIDGKPLESGKVVFEEAEGVSAGVPYALDIKGGTFEGQVSTGKKKVMINSYKTVTPPKGPGTTPMMTGPGYENQTTEVNVIPAKYNTESKEMKEVKDGPNEFTFEVTSK